MTFDATSCTPSDLRGVDNATAANQEQLQPNRDPSPLRTNEEQSTERIAGRTGGQSMGAECSDEFLLDQLREGDHGALALLFRRYARLVRTVAYRILHDAAEADDVVQEVFLFVFRKGALFDAARGSARSWIVQVTYHRAIDRRRHLVSRHFYLNAELDETLLTIEPITDSVFYDRSVEAALGIEMLRRIEEDLSSDQQKTIQLHFFDGYSFEEIAELTGQAVGNIRNHYYRGLERIRKLVFTPELRDK
jgi:RNA polymerase sigma-70 factor (ECF subfamily)